MIGGRQHSSVLAQLKMINSYLVNESFTLCRITVMTTGSWRAGLPMIENATMYVEKILGYLGPGGLVINTSYCVATSENVTVR